MRERYDDEQQSHRGRPLAAQKVRAAPRVRLPRGPSPIARIARGGAPRAARGTFATGC